MNTTLNQILEEMQRQSKVCETVAGDKNQEALTGASADKEKNLGEAAVWLAKSKVWLEAHELVQTGRPDPLPETCGPVQPPPIQAPCEFDRSW